VRKLVLFVNSAYSTLLYVIKNKVSFVEPIIAS